MPVFAFIMPSLMASCLVLSATGSNWADFSSDPPPQPEANAPDAITIPDKNNLNPKAECLRIEQSFQSDARPGSPVCWNDKE
jgi:hypothetical protein